MTRGIDVPYPGRQKKSMEQRCFFSQVVPPDSAEARMDEVRRGYNYEGEVMYFMDSKWVLSMRSLLFYNILNIFCIFRDNVIGLLKKKTAWYVVCR